MANSKVIYKITYPNEKIFIGKDLTNILNYYGSADSKIIEQDFPEEERKVFIIKKEIIWESQTASDQLANQKEIECIKDNNSNNPQIGYNRWPKRMK